MLFAFVFCRMTCNKIKNRKLVERQEIDWKFLSAKEPSPIQQLEWTKACLETLHEGNKLSVIEVSTDSIPDAIAPLIKQSGSLPRLRFPGSEELHYPMDFLYERPEALDRLSRAIVRTGLPVKLTKVPSTSATPEALRRAYRGRGWVFIRPDDSDRRLSINDSWVTPEQHMSASQRKNYRRRRRIAEQMGNVSFEVHVPAPSCVDALLTEAFAVEARSWKGRAGTALANDTMKKRFFERYALLAAKQGILRVFFLRINDRAAAMDIAIEHGGRLWLLKHGYDEHFKKCSPGFLETVELLRYAAQHRLSSTEFLGDETWFDMAPWQHQSSVSIDAYPISLVGIAAFAADVSSWVVRKLGRSLQRLSIIFLRPSLALTRNQE